MAKTPSSTASTPSTGRDPLNLLFREVAGTIPKGRTSSS
jgi:hypothetical protein